ncbi:MAG TPA: biotin transporter BioY [Clostridiaceae bacterium]|nr:biotin transporter BioY [Clostridiaceae bacterium]
MKISARDISQIALFTALTAVGAFIKIPIPVVPITLQVFFVSLSGVLLGSRKGAISQLLYVLIGLAGFPIFTQGGGIAYVLKPTFGYLAGFIFGAYLTGKMTEKMKEKNIKNLFIAILSGVGVIYAVGVAYLYMINNFYLGKDFTLWLAFYYGFLLCIGGDLICSYVASVLSYKLLPVIRKWVA